jgi:hypothetical protein
MILITDLSKTQKATQIITASEDDINPVIVTWDVRNAHAPEKVFVKFLFIVFLSLIFYFIYFFFIFDF